MHVERAHPRTHTGGDGGGGRGDDPVLARWQGMLRAGGCEQPEQVMRSFRQIVEQGTAPMAKLPPSASMRAASCVRGSGTFAARART